MTRWDDALQRWGEFLGVSCDRLRLEADRLMSPSLDELGLLLDALRVDKAMLVVDRVAVAAAGVEDTLAAALGGRIAVEFDGFSPNPKSEDAARAARLAAEHQVEAIVAVGGGSCLDAAKVAAVGARAPGAAEQLSRGAVAIDVESLPVVAVPTTSGTGSEATRFAAMYVDGAKVSVVHEGMRPRAVVLDPRLHVAMPAGLAAATGLDALGQAMESLWAVGSTDESALDAACGGRLVAKWLEESVSRRSEEARTAVMLGAHLAGRAIDVSKTTAAHALSYELTMRHGIPHGHAVGLTLGHVGAGNFEVGEIDCADPRGPDHVRRRVREAAGLLGVEPVGLPEAVSALIDRLGLASSLSAAGVPFDSAATLAASIDPVRSGNNPRRLDPVTTLALVRRAWPPS
jgi:alcohol dehydrogenase